MNDNETNKPEVLVPVDIKRSEDAMGTVWLVDGTRLLIRTIVTNVVIVEGKEDKDGNSFYKVYSQTQVVVKPRRN